MKAIERLYEKDNYTIQRSVNLEDTLYTRLKELVEKKYDASISDIINVSIEHYINRNEIKYVPKDKDEITIYRSVMIRKKNFDTLTEISNKTGIFVTRLINMAIKQFLDEYDK